MSDDGERTCPLCAEEMDLTDQQLKPCKCGYDICVWCWHHLNDMAEKEDMEGRCPACRTPYDKEKIVGMASNCRRIMAEINADRKQKPQKLKPKTSAESRKHLTSVRVIQRSLVYIVGLPHNLCDESLLERKEYFGQYGKVLKVSISRAGAASQQASNNSTFSVYITYTKEEEAVRCIQAVHNFVLEGKPLRACFGTTKYCHAWLRNMTCSNPDCLYLHDIGSQEDSFTKDEVISAYSRSRVPQVALNNVQRSGNVLPPPSDDFSNCGTISGKQNPPSQVKGSNGISGKSTVLPATASWGSRVSNGRTASMPCSQSSVKQNLETATCASLLSSFNENTKQTSAWHDDVEPTSKLPEGRHVMHMVGISRPIESAKLNSRSDRQTIVSGVSSETFMEAVCSAGDSAWDDDVLTVSKIPKERQVIHLDGRSSSLETSILDNGEECQTSGLNMLSDAVSDATCTSVISMSCSSSPLAPSTEDNKRGIVVPTNNGNPVNSTSPQGLIRHSISSGTDKVSNGCTGANRDIQIVCSGLSSVKIDSHLGFDRLHMDLQQSSVSNLCSTTMPRNPASRFEQSHSEHEEECSASARLIKIPSLSDTLVSERPSDWGSEPRKQFSPSTGNEIDDSFVSGDNECHRLPGVINQTSCTPYLNHRLDATRHSSNNFSNVVESTCHSVNGEFSFVDTNVDRALFPFRENECTLSNRHMDGSLSSYSDPGKSFKCSDVHYTDEKAKCLGIFDDADNIYETTSPDVGDSRFISDILSLDFDPWDESSSSANNFAKLLGETDKQDGSFKSSSSLKLQNSNQSRFPFARPENQERDLQSSLRDIVNSRKACSSLQDSYGDGFQNAPPFNTFQGPNSMVNSNPVNSSGKPSGVSRGKISAPPGFSVPTKVPPPGFSSQDRYDQAHNTTYSENHLLAGPYGNQYQVHSAANTGDVEFIDPAILAVGKGRIPLAVNNRSLSSRSTFPSQFSMLENDSRLQLLMQQSISSHTNMPRPDYVGDNFLSFNDAFVTSQLLSQNHSSLSPFAQLQQPTNSRILSSQWDGWNLQTGNGVSMTEIMRNERFRPNNYFPSNEEHNFHIPSSGDLYNRAFGM